MAARWLAGLAASWLTGATVPSGISLSITERAIVVVDGGRVISTATICPGYQFVSIGAGGAHVSPDLHWILVDIRGPFSPGNVPLVHALVYVPTGSLVLSPDFTNDVGVPITLDPLSWASGERASLRYNDGRTAALRDPPARARPVTQCTSAM